MTALKPAESANIMAKIGAMTEKQPFTARAQGINSGLVLPRNERASGKGTPIRMPAGIRMMKTDRIFVISE